jgi:pilus assembly protein Flp/PilA
MVKLFVTLESFVAFARERMREEKGATAVEYGLMVGLIAAVIIGTVFTLGGQLQALFAMVVAALPGGGGATP